MKETLKLRDWGYYGEAKPERTVEVEYVPVPHWSTTEKSLKAYDIGIDGKVVGRCLQTRANTSAPLGRGSRLVRPLKGTIEWSWQRPRNEADDGPGLGPIYNSPGCYAKTRREAVAEILGYSRAEKV